ncbi:unnamed protein product [Sphenostylis stenocarpa]|uniref:Uncharacterized protein n=1 Tax=Sphenostylis stenocarpa TaxID=92480 RepID=A0AA86SM99_9FABA|nr:unnamed protein product [Sphenostylis stenocarpa]
MTVNFEYRVAFCYVLFRKGLEKQSKAKEEASDRGIMGDGGSMTKRNNLHNPLSPLLQSFYVMYSLECRFRSAFDSYSVACEAFSEPHPSPL